MKRLLGLLFVVLVLTVGTTSVFALDITVFDKNAHTQSPNYGQDTTWWTNTNENNEVEPGNVTTQAWDLEQFLYNQTTMALTLVGGYDFQHGVKGNAGRTYTSGDIFLDLNGDMLYGIDAKGKLNLSGDGNKDIKNVFGYDYVVHFNKNADGSLNGSYGIYALSANSTLKSVYYRSNDESGAWMYDPSKNLTNNTLPSPIYQGTVDLTHPTAATYTMTVDLSFLQTVEQKIWFTAKYTMGCGNDDLIGFYDPVPEPGTLILLGGGLLSLCAILRKRML